MNLLFRITYAAYAKGTHHKLALDALQHLEGPDVDAWQRVFLKHAKAYVEGSKAPDDSFKDFTNHVLHTRDGLWGGAPDKARAWYQELVEALVGGDWAKAVYNAGVLSHYYTDPLMPFHTAQSEAENNIHRAAEWSISRSYDDLRELGVREWCVKEHLLALPQGENWLAEMVVANARMANLSYEKLIAHYDIKRGVVDPPAGLDAVGRRIIAELLRFAALTFADVLERAFAEAGVRPPDISLTGPMLIAVAGIPVNMLVKRIEDAQERRLVQAMYDELQATGTVQTTLPEDDRVVRDRHAAEVLGTKPAPVEASQAFPFTPRLRLGDRLDAVREGGPTAADNVVELRPGPLAATSVPTVAPPPKPAMDERVPPPLSHLASVASVLPPAVEEPRAVAPSPTPAPEVAAVVPAAARAPERLAQQLRYHLAPDHDVVDAPSIGPKTAERLYAHGIRSVRDLLIAEPEALAAKLDARHIDARVIEDWQFQAQMVCDVPGLRGTHAQLLVGAGYKTSDAVAAAQPDKLCADVLTFARSTEGQRVLRNGDAPDIEKIKGWLDAARSTIAA